MFDVPKWAAPCEPRPVGFMRGLGPVLLLDFSGGFWFGVWGLSGGILGLGARGVLWGLEWFPCAAFFLLF